MVLTLLTNIERVKRRGSYQGTDGTDDQLLEELIAEVSADMEDFVGRHLISTARTESYRLRAHQHNISLRGYPVASVASVKVSSRNDDFGNITALDTTLWVLDADAGSIFLRSETTVYAPTYVQVVYTGGLVTSSGDDPAGLTSNFIATYPHIAASADQEVVVRNQRRKMPNAGQIVHKGAMVQMPSDMRLLGDTMRRLAYLKPARIS